MISLMWLSAALGGIGLMALLYKRTVLGLVVGMQLLTLGGTSLLIFAGASSGSALVGHLFAFFITIVGVAQMVGAYAVATRMFYLKGNTSLDELRSLKR
jgi:NADH:ubiquinone oxidoreductase subunit K